MQTTKLEDLGIVDDCYEDLAFRRLKDRGCIFTHEVQKGEQIFYVDIPGYMCIDEVGPFRRGNLMMFLQGAYVGMQ